MSKIVFLNKTDVVYDCEFTQIKPSQVRLVFTDSVPTEDVLISGFNIVNEHNNMVMTERHDFNNIYRKYSDGKTLELCNDGIAYEDEEYSVEFLVHSGGTLNGETSQSVKTYEELVPPNPVPNENYVFLKWSPELPKKGKLEKNERYVAVFEYVTTQEDILNMKIAEISIACDELINSGVEVDGEKYTYTSNERTDLVELYNTVSATGLPIGYQNADGVCREYSAQEIVKIYVSQLTNKYSQETYRNQVILYLKSLPESEENKTLISEYKYGTELTGEYLTHYNDMLRLYQAQITAIIPSEISL